MLLLQCTDSTRKPQPCEADEGSNMDAKSKTTKSGTLTVGNQNWTFPVYDGTIGPAVIDISKLYNQAGMFTYESRLYVDGQLRVEITYIDGEEGVLLYRGYPIEQVADTETFSKPVIWLLYGELPTPSQKIDFDNRVPSHDGSRTNEPVLSGFRRDAHPMANHDRLCRGAFGLLPRLDRHFGSFQRMVASIRMMRRCPRCGDAYKYSVGSRSSIRRTNSIMRAIFCGCAFAVPCGSTRSARYWRARWIVFFILHADHEQNASTSTVRWQVPRAPTRSPALQQVALRFGTRPTVGPTKPTLRCLKRLAMSSEFLNSSGALRTRRFVPPYGLRPSGL